MTEPEQSEQYLQVPRERIRELKKVLRKRPYSEVIEFVEKPHNTVMAQAIEGTRGLLMLGNTLMLLAKVLPLAALLLLIFVGWKWSLAVALAWGALNGFRSELNLEIAARSIAVSQAPDP